VGCLSNSTLRKQWENRLKIRAESIDQLLDQVFSGLKKGGAGWAGYLFIS
jgi:hypothetical protein